MLVSYVRCSDEAQNEARQLEALKKFNIEKWYIEKVSGKDTKREQLQLMLDFVREGDVIYVHDFSRLSRSVIRQIKYGLIPQIKNDFLRYADAL